MKCRVKRQSPSKADKKVYQTSGAHQRFAEDSDESDDPIFSVERVGTVSVDLSHRVQPYSYNSAGYWSDEQCNVLYKFVEYFATWRSSVGSTWRQHKTL